MSYFIGIDGGGSKTEAAIGDEQRVLARVTVPSCKVQAVGEERARAALHQALAEACRAAGIVPAQLARGVIGVSGFSRAGVADWLRARASELTTADIEVVGDNAIAYAAAFGDAPGVLVIAGTGSIAFGRNAKGDTARAGGWGPLISDEGSGTWIGREAVRQAMRAADRGDAPALLADIMGAWQVTAREAVASAANQQPAPDLAALFPLVLRQAEAGDKIATEILAQAASQLAQLARDVVTRLFASESAEVAVAGGVFASAATVRQIFRKTLQNLCPAVRVQDAMVEPVLGALAMARRSAGHSSAGGGTPTQ